MASYSNGRAMWAIMRASLQGTLKSPSAVFFSIAFPLIFILVFGFLGNTDRVFKIPVAFGSETDSSLELVHQLIHAPVFDWQSLDSNTPVSRALSEGKILAEITVVPEQEPGKIPGATIHVLGSSASVQKLTPLRYELENVLLRNNSENIRRIRQFAKIDVTVAQLRAYKNIDFILPGQLGFSLLAAGVFGTAFVFFNMRQMLVLKRFFTTPVRREVIIIGESLARLLFQMAGAIVVIAVGYFLFDFTMINGWITFIEMMIVCALALMVFMGMGFIVSGLAKNESTIPPIANIITLPQFLLAGTFFPIEDFPTWLQPFCRILPLTYLNDALRKIAFEGASLADVKWDIFFIVLSGIIVYALATKLFKWE